MPSSELPPRQYPHPMKKFEPYVLLVLVSIFYLLSWIKEILLTLWEVLDSALAPAGVEREPKPLVVRTPDERFVGLDRLGYTFKPNYLQLPHLPLRIHYLDEGPRDGPVVLCLHGEPTWSFLYRKMIPMAGGYRVIAPDFVGFGKSDKYVSASLYNMELHLLTLKHLIQELDLSEMTLVCQDWGGLIGLPLVADITDKFANLVILNTAIPAGAPLDKLRGGAAFLLWRSSMAFLGENLSVEWLFRKVCHYRPEVAAAYNAPFPNKDYKGGVAQFPLMVPLHPWDAGAPHMTDARRMCRQWSKPALIMFGAKDKVMNDEGADFQSLIPSAKRVVIPRGNHFVQEDAGEELAENIVKFLQGKM